MRLRLSACALIAGVALVLTAAVTAPTRTARGTVDVYYAASLKALNEDSAGPAFQAKTGYTFQGFPNNSGILVNQIKAGIIAPDVVEFADTSSDHQLMGAANHNIVRWYVPFARTHLVIGFNPRSRYAPLFREVQHGRLPWYRPLLSKGLKFGRTDPNSDPKGYRTIFAFNLAQRLYHLKHFTRRVLGVIKNPDPRGFNSESAQVFPEATLVSQLSSGNLDAGVFYLPEAKAARIPYIGLPQAISFGSPRYARLDATQTYTSSKGIKVTGSPSYYTITIPGTVKDKAGAIAFVKFALSGPRRLFATLGLQTVAHVIHGDKNAAPKGI